MPKQALNYPFSAVVGQKPLKLALTLAAINPLLGGVLVSGPRGSAKSTLSKSLADVLSTSACPTRPFVHLPLGTTEEMLVGSLDIERALQDQQAQFKPGVLAKADGGVLYVDEVNLLPDNLVDQLLDVAASGINTIERDGISHSHTARFILLGTMNPEEGELRSQLVDRFGLAVTLDKQFSINERLEVVRRREQFDQDPQQFCQHYSAAQQQLQQSIKAARQSLTELECSDDIRRLIAERCFASEVDGLRADIVWLQAAKAHAAWQQQTQVRQEDVLSVEELVLGHRRLSSEPLPPPSGSGNSDNEDGEDTNHGSVAEQGSQTPTNEAQSKGSNSSARSYRRPPASRRPQEDGKVDNQLDESPIPADEPESDLNNHSHRENNRADGHSSDNDSDGGDNSESLGNDWGSMPMQPVEQQSVGCLPSTSSISWSKLRQPLRRVQGNRISRHRTTGSVENHAFGCLQKTSKRVNWFASLVASMGRFPLSELVFRSQRQQYTPVHMVMLDTSASVLRDQALACARGLLDDLSHQAYLKRHRLLIMGFGNQQTTTLLPLQRAPKSLAKQMPILVAGGGTPLQAVVDSLAQQQQQLLRRQPGIQFYNYMITDGRIRRIPNGLGEKLAGQTVVIDIEAGPIKRGRSRQLADAFGGRYVAMPTA